MSDSRRSLVRHPSANGGCIRQRSQDQHGVAVTVKAVAFGNGCFVRGLNQSVAAERLDQHEERASGKMEIRQ
jgi:hypothetical protein